MKGSDGLLQLRQLTPIPLMVGGLDGHRSLRVGNPIVFCIMPPVMSCAELYKLCWCTNGPSDDYLLSRGQYAAVPLTACIEAFISAIWVAETCNKSIQMSVQVPKF